MKTFEAIPGKPIPLGRLGENERLQVLFDVSAWLAEYPNAAIGLMNRLPNAEEAYPVILTYPVDGKAGWTITSAELSVKGDGLCELIATVGTVVAKSEFYRTVILDALDGSGEVPDQWETYQAQFTAIAGAAQAAQAGAEDAADLAEMWATGGSSGTPSATNNAEYWAEKAHGSSTNAETFASEASTARNAAETAQGKAEDAQDAAEAAQDAAETAQGKAEDAQDAAETAQGKAEDAQDAAEDAADEAMMWATGGTSPSPASSTNNAHYWSTKAGEFAGVAEEAASDAQAAQAAAEQAAEEAHEIIDDTAGAGDTDKTWSADKIAGSIPDVSGKADKANTVLTTTLSRGRKANTTAGTGSFAFGNDTTASANYAHAEGDNTTASGTYAHAEGQDTIANKSTAHAEGQGTTASGIGAHAEGAFTTASKTAAHAEGSSTEASGSASHAEGYKTEASGTYSSSRGSDSKASGQASDASGYHTEANHAYQHVFGAYNVPDDSSAAASAKGNYVEIVGNGTGSSAKSNARTLDWDGNERLKGDLYVGANADGTGGTKVAKITDVPDPEDLIDDEAGAGDTDKVFSADKVTSELSDVKSEIQHSTKGIIPRNNNVTDGVYASCRYHQPNATSKQFCILMGADFHEDATRLASMVEYLNAVDAFDAGIVLGDIAGNTWQDDATYYTDEISKTEKPFLTVIGNHDAGSGNTITTSYTNIADLYNKFIAPNIQYADLSTGEHQTGDCYYYKDFSIYGIRLIVLNEYDYPADNDGTNFLYVRGNNCFSQAQIDWFVDTLNDTPDGYGVIVAMHFIPSTVLIDRSTLWTASTMKYNSYGPGTMFASGTPDDRTIISDIVDAWSSGSSISRTYHFTVNGSWNGIDVEADFTERGSGEFITYIGGHLHMSIKSSIYAYQTQNCYNMDASSMTASRQGDTPRKEGTRSEDLLCVLAVDREQKIVKLLQIGAHFTKDADERLYGKFSYGVSCTGLALSDNSITLSGAGETKQISAIKTPANTTDAVDWASSNEQVVTVINGLVTCVGDGTATVTATCGSQTASCSVIATTSTVINITDLQYMDGHGFTSTNISANPPKDYIADEVQSRRRLYFTETNKLNGYPMITNKDISFDDVYPIPIPNGATKLNISVNAVWSACGIVFANANEKYTYSLSSSYRLDACRAYSNIIHTATTTTHEISIDIPSGANAFGMYVVVPSGHTPSEYTDTTTVISFE